MFITIQLQRHSIMVWRMQIVDELRSLHVCICGGGLRHM
eukprot:jgi/Antlo1/1480/26